MPFELLINSELEAAYFKNNTKVIWKNSKNDEISLWKHYEISKEHDLFIHPNQQVLLFLLSKLHMWC